ncbi:hypothetical protein HPB50_020228 [Hyalomma asiaticum]|uniref:Uncharacterized protein n=1 Tax=Hyalomma asiaticum TaxID=266040 RepID=A0ACB7SNT0_HYAAI|nr:hypothetical protein HPB50_020228 [Hyalomma asiaticum]
MLKGQRLRGWECLVFLTKKNATTGYHREMDGPRFERRLTETLLPNIEPRSVIIIDNAQCHSVQLKKLPTTSSCKADIQSWFTEKKEENIPWFNRNKYNFSGYRIDVLGNVAGHDIVRLPLYHCELNPIEMVWSQVKGYTAATTHH